MSVWEARRVLVTGITGLAGTHLADRLVDAGAEVIGLIRDRVPFDRFHASGLALRVVQVEGCCEDMGLMTRIFNEYRPSVVFHLAAQTQVTLALDDPAGAFESNIRGTWSLLEAARRFEAAVGAILVASSDKAYGPSSRLPYDESTPLEARAPYDVSKACADLIARSYRGTYGLPIIVTRCANLFGEGDLHWHRLIPEAARAWLTGHVPILRSDGTPRRDYLYAGDAADAMMELAERRLAGTLVHDVYNISASQPLTVNEMLECLRSALERRLRRSLPPPRVLGTARHEIDAQWLSAARIREETGWQPRHTLDRAIEKTLDYYQNFFDAH